MLVREYFWFVCFKKVFTEGLAQTLTPLRRVDHNLSLDTVRTLLVAKRCILKLHNEDREAHLFLSKIACYNLVIVKMKYEPITKKAF